MKKANDWADMISNLRSTKIEEVPEDFLQVKDWAKKQNIDKSTAADLIKRSYDSGLMEKKSFRIQTGSGVRAIAHYKIIK